MKISSVAERNASSVALKAISTFNGVGIFGIELFLLNDESVLLNEIAPRYYLHEYYKMIILVLLILSSCISREEV